MELKFPICELKIKILVRCLRVFESETSSLKISNCHSMIWKKAPLANHLKEIHVVNSEIQYWDGLERGMEFNVFFNIWSYLFDQKFIFKKSFREQGSQDCSNTHSWVLSGYPSALEIGVARSLCFAWNPPLLPLLFHDAEAKDKKIKDCIAGTGTLPHCVLLLWGGSSSHQLLFY